MSAQAAPIITAPLPLLRIPLERWQPGQTVREFLDALSVDYIVVQTCNGYGLIRKN